jgi:hypothetical protein
VTVQLLDRDHALREAAQRLIGDYAEMIPSGQVLAAVARAKVHVHDGLRVVRLPLPPTDEYLALVVGLARQELSLRLKPEPSKRPGVAMAQRPQPAPRAATDRTLFREVAPQSSPAQ